MHVHLVGGDLDVTIELAELRIIEGVLPAELKREVIAWLKEHQSELIQEWQQWKP